MNDLILRKLKEFDDKNSLEQGLKSFINSSDAPLTFTPVTEQSFARWCEGYMEKLQKLKEERMSEADLKLTGR
jgi:hypothetical protein